MTRYYGHKSRYARSLSFKYIGLIFLTLSAMVLAAQVLGKLSKLSQQPIFALGILLGFLFIAAIGPEIAKVFEKRSDKVDRGSWGESSVRKILVRLPNSYAVFEDVVVGKFGNIDFVVVGPNGVFAIEVKSHRGKIGFNGSELTNYGRVFEKNFLNQAWGEKKSLEEFLRSRGVSVSAVPVLVFSRAWVNPSAQPLRGVHVLGRQSLCDFIVAHPGRLPQQPICEELLKSTYTK